MEKIANLTIPKPEKKKFVMPDTYVIIIILIIFMVAMTYIIPAGTYDYAKDGKTIIADSFHFVDRNPAGLSDFLNSFFKGMQQGASTIFLVFLIGGAFQILTDTGTIDAVLSLTVQKTKSNYVLIFPAIIVVMSVLGALGVGNNVALAFAPILIILCRKLRLDPIVVVGAMYLASNTGFSTSPMNPFTVLLGQDISGIPQMSGMFPRSIMWVIFTSVVIWWILRYCKRILANPSKSYMGIYELDPNDAEEDKAMHGLVKMKLSHIINLLILIGVFVVYAYGGIKFNWGLSTLGAAMMVLAFSTGIIGRLGANQMAKSFIKGAQVMVYSALLIGFASAINVIMSDANIIHSVIYYLTLPLVKLPTAIAAVGMFISNFLFNFFVCSGSGQCYVVMPICAPAADVLHFSRQVAVSAYQLGDGLCNSLIPTSGLLMGTLGIAKVPYDKWLKFAFPVTMILAGISAVFLIIMTLLGWS
ncbi:MAG: Na+/H+ antiporter NhaC family protein [Dehalobacterium sp.]